MTDEGRDAETGRFTEGNEFWRTALNAYGTLGRTPQMLTEEQLIEKASKYFAWVTDNPLREERSWQSDGVVVTHAAPVARVMTITGLCNFLGITYRTWKVWRNEREDLQNAVEMIDQIIQQHKIELASAGLVQHAFISKLMGLADVNTVQGPGGGPVQVDDGKDWSNMEIARRMAFLLAQAVQHKKEQADGDSETE